MRPSFLLAASLATALLVSPEAARSAVATAAATFLEAVPFLLAGYGLTRIGRFRELVPLLGCGCGAGPAARSLPAAVATALLFGPAIAAARLGAAWAVASLLARRRRRAGCAAAFDEGMAWPGSLLTELADLVPSALLAGAAAQLTGALEPGRVPPGLALSAGGLLAFASSPCGLGAGAVAAALHVRAPMLAGAYLSVAGIVDFRTFAPPVPHKGAQHDALAYALLAAALAAVAARGGATLVHPAFVPALALCGAVCALAAARHRRSQAGVVRLAPILMLVGAVVGAPAPHYHATETTMTDLFAGERLRFTGTLSRADGQAALVRYAITCCRADASPIAVRLTRSPAYPDGTWLQVDGIVESGSGTPRLNAKRVARVASPADPFVYR